ncbi:hypothetical protein ACAG75_30195, partial [Klebsiella pneumoniae]|uniref:hypothetical protein n=1 Tax=Klebsiella pneumoniae TaxID=573 RepID=UPI00385EDC72
YWAANGHQRQINSDIFKFITSVWGILVHAVGKKAPSGALATPDTTAFNGAMRGCAARNTVESHIYLPKCGHNVDILRISTTSQRVK